MAAYGVGVTVLERPGGRIVRGDAVHYYVYVRSALFDRDLHFRNDYITLYDVAEPLPSGLLWLDRPTPTGHVRNMMSVGPAMAWTPGFVAAIGGVGVARALGSAYPLDGFGRWFQASAGISGILVAVLGAWLTFKLCASTYGTFAAMWGTLLVWFGSSAVYYSVVSPTYSHAVSMFAVSALFLYWTASRNTQTIGRYVRVGALAGIVTLVRWQDAVFLIVPFVEVLSRMQELPAAERWRWALGRLAVCGAGALAAFSPQILTWMILYGSPAVMPQGEEWMQWGSPHFVDVLFSNRHGLFSWTPVCALALAGLVLLHRRDRVLAAACIASFAVSFYANAAVLEWWAGEAFGLRRFVSCFPIFALGAAALVDRFARRPTLVAATVVVFVAANLILLVHYQAFMHGIRDNLPYPENVFSSPGHLVRWVRSL